LAFYSRALIGWPRACWVDDVKGGFGVFLLNPRVTTFSLIMFNSMHSKNLEHMNECRLCGLIQHNVLHLMPEILIQNPIPKLNNLGFYDSLSHCDQLLHTCIGLLQTFMRFTLKFLQSAKFPSLHPLTISV
jgi:hypothetical protein